MLRLVLLMALIGIDEHFDWFLQAAEGDNQLHAIGVLRIGGIDKQRCIDAPSIEGCRHFLPICARVSQGRPKVQV